MPEGTRRVRPDQRQLTGDMSAPRDKLAGPRRRHRHGHRDLARHRQEGNWDKLAAGESGIRTVTRFPIDGLKTTMAGTVDFVTSIRTPPPASPSASPTSRPRKRSPRPASAPRAISRARCSWRWRRSRSNGRSVASSAAPSASRTSAIAICCASRRRQVRRPPPSLHVRLGRRAISPRPSAPRARRSRCRSRSAPPPSPAPRPSSA